MVLIGYTAQYYKLKLNCSGAPNHRNIRVYPIFTFAKV